MTARFFCTVDQVPEKRVQKSGGNLALPLVALALIFGFGLLQPATSFAKPIIRLRSLESRITETPRLKEQNNDITAAKENIKMLKAESSAIFQGRIKVGHYSHFNYDGIPRNYIAKPKIGFKYYLFGGNKYLKHIIDRAQPRYYLDISSYDSAFRETKKEVAKYYLSYWSHYEADAMLSRVSRIKKYENRLSKLCHSQFRRFQLTVYLEKMHAQIARRKLSELLGRTLPAFIPRLPGRGVAEKIHKSSILQKHPGIAGLIRYYSDQKKLGWLRFVNVKFKAFLRPSYYPSAGRTKLAVIGGVYVNIPFDILGAERHANAQLAAQRENILLKLQQDGYKEKEQERIEKIRMPIYSREVRFWKHRAEHYYRRLIRQEPMTLAKSSEAGELARTLDQYRKATLKWIAAAAHLALIRFG